MELSITHASLTHFKNYTGGDFLLQLWLRVHHACCYFGFNIWTKKLQSNRPEKATTPMCKWSNYLIKDECCFFVFVIAPKINDILDCTGTNVFHYRNKEPLTPAIMVTMHPFLHELLWFLFIQPYHPWKGSLNSRCKWTLKLYFFFNFSFCMVLLVASSLSKRSKIIPTMLFYKLTLPATITSCLLLPSANEVWLR